MKIAIIHRNSFDMIGGVESTLYYMAEVLKEMGHTPVIIAKKRADVTPEDTFCKVVRYTESPIKAKILCMFSPLFEYLNARKKLKQILEEEKPDYIITRDNILSYAVSSFFEKNKIVYIPLGVIKYYNAGIRKFNSIKSFLMECIRYISLKQESYYQIKAIKALDKVVVFSRNMKKQVFSATGKDNSMVIHPGVSSKFRFDANSHLIREEFSIPDDKKILLFIGRVVQEKNVRMLAQAFAESKNENTVLMIVGGGDDLEYVKNLTTKLGIADKVIFTGFRRDVEKFYCEADLFILPSYYESFGNVILEALASGTPVVGFPTEEGKTLTAIDELIEDGKNGFICERYSTQALTEAIDRAVSLMGTEKYNKMKRYCAESAKETYTWQRFMTQVLKILKEM